MAVPDARGARRRGALDRRIGLFPAAYTASFASYNKTSGALSAVIVMLTSLWLTGMALLLGGEINAEIERSRELREA